MKDVTAISGKIVMEKGNEAQCERNIMLVANLYHVLLEERKFERFDEFFSKTIRIEKDYETPWDYETALLYGQQMLQKYDRATFLPFSIIIACGDYVTAEYIERLYQKGKLIKAVKFTTIYHIVNDRVDKIIETSAVDPAPQ